jgi:hypothetical protein
LHTRPVQRAEARQRFDCLYRVHRLPVRARYTESYPRPGAGSRIKGAVASVRVGLHG